MEPENWNLFKEWKGRNKTVWWKECNTKKTCWEETHSNGINE